MFRRVTPFLCVLGLVACSDEPTDPSEDVLLDSSDDARVDADAPETDADAAESDADAAEPEVDAAEADADATEPDADVIEYECGTTSPEELAACVDGDSWWADMEAMDGIRLRGTASWQRTQDLCADRLESLGYEVERQDWGGGVNVIGVRLGTVRPDEFVVVGAHYDTMPVVAEGGGFCPGADDNASAVAGALEVARVLASQDHARSTVIACWDYEEGGRHGSRAHANRAAADGDVIAAVFALEMIAYADNEPNSQVLPDGFSLFFPDTVTALDARDWRGDFLAAIGDVNAQEAMGALERIGSTTGVDMVTVPVPLEFRAATALADLRRSDHSVFWDANYPAIMVTDTANFRNPNYHCRDGLDTLDTLDRDFAWGAIANTTGAAAIMLASETAPAGPPVYLPECTLSEGGCGDGETCSLVSINVVGSVETCVEADGTKELEEACTRSEFGVDDCAAGLICTRYERTFVDGDAEPWCMALCEKSADCADGQRCQVSGSTSSTGICVTDCDPASQGGCPDNSHCRVESSVGAIELGGLCANELPPGQPGVACQEDLECGGGYGCSSETGTCTRLCTDATPCAEGTCTPYPRETTIPGLGFCTTGE